MLSMYNFGGRAAMWAKWRRCAKPSIHELVAEFGMLLCPLGFNGRLDAAFRWTLPSEILGPLPHHQGLHRCNIIPWLKGAGPFYSARRKRM
jgi:hypothetical protein